MAIRYDYELDGMKLSRWNPATEKSSNVKGLFGNDLAAERAASSDLNRLANLSKNGAPAGRFTANGSPWKDI